MINTKRVMGMSIVLFILASFVPNIYRSHIKVSKLEKELCSLVEEKDALEEKIGTYEKEIKDLESIKAKEEIVRNKLQMVKPGEIIYRVTE